MSEQVDPRLRAALQHITGHGVKPVDHPDLVRGIAYPHSIEPLEPEPEINARLENYTCFMHALDVPDSNLVVRIASELDDVFPGTEFVEHLLETLLRPVPKSEVLDMDLAIYVCDGRPAHAGRFDSGLIVSKWGTGLIWRHPMFEVPSSYGDEVLLLRQPGRRAVEKEFLDFAKAKAGPDTIERILGAPPE